MNVDIIRQEDCVVEDPQYKSFFHITTIGNISSILKHGLFCKNVQNEKKIKFESLSNKEVMARREGKTIDGKSLLSYVDTYFNPRNSMMFTLVHNDKVNPRGKDNLVVFKIKINIHQNNCVITNHNAASSYAKFFFGSHISNETFKQIQNDADQKWFSIWGRAKTEVMAECLIEKHIPVSSFESIEVPNQSVSNKIQNEYNTGLPINLNTYIFV